MPRVFISDKLESAGIDVLRQAGIEIDDRPGLKGSDLCAALRSADGIIVRSGTRLTCDILEAPGNLRAIVRAGVGVDNIDVAAATRHGIVVMNTPGGNTISTAEHTVAMLMALARHIPSAHASLHQGKWERNRFVGSQLAGKCLGVVGLGRVGREVARRAAGLDMKVLGFDPVLSPDRAAQLGIEAVSSLDQILPRCDFLTVHTPLIEETRDLIGAAEIAAMKRGARLLNCARGGIVNEQSLHDALVSGHLAGAALDVFVEEPPPVDHPLLKLDGVIATPHLGASTAEAQESVAREAGELMRDYLTRGAIQFAVNMAPIDRAEFEEMRLHIDMARRLGLLNAQMCRGTIRRVVLSYRGEVARHSTRLVTSAFAAGLLETRLEESVNIVNAELLARERGIEITEEISKTKGDFGTLIKVDVFADQEGRDRRYESAGTVFGHQFLRLVQLGPYHLDTYMDGVLLILTHRDVPGLIGFIGTILGEHQVNIAQMTVGRQVAGGEAIAVLNLDGEPPESAVMKVRDHGQVSSVSVVKLPAAGELPTWLR